MPADPTAAALGRHCPACAMRCDPATPRPSQPRGFRARLSWPPTMLAPLARMFLLTLPCRTDSWYPVRVSGCLLLILLKSEAQAQSADGELAHSTARTIYLATLSPTIASRSTRPAVAHPNYQCIVLRTAAHPNHQCIALHKLSRSSS